MSAAAAATSHAPATHGPSPASPRARAAGRAASHPHRRHGLQHQQLPRSAAAPGRLPPVGLLLVLHGFKPQPNAGWEHTHLVGDRTGLCGGVTLQWWCELHRGPGRLRGCALGTGCVQCAVCPTLLPRPALAWRAGPPACVVVCVGPDHGRRKQSARLCQGGGGSAGWLPSHPSRQPRNMQHCWGGEGEVAQQLRRARP